MQTYDIKREESLCRVVLHGDLTAAILPGIQVALKKELTDGVAEVEFDLAETGMMDSSGIGLLIAVSNSLARDKGRIRVVNVSRDIKQLLQSMRLVARLNVSEKS